MAIPAGLRSQAGIAVVLWLWAISRSLPAGRWPMTALLLARRSRTRRVLRVRIGVRISRIGPLARFQCVRPATSAMRFGMR